MSRNIALAIAPMVAAAGLAACGDTEPAASAAAPAAPAQEAAAEPPYRAAHDIQELMAFVVEPNAQVFWGSAGWVIDAEGEHDLTPTTEEGWAATHSAAVTVTEMGNLLMTPIYAEGRNPDWMQFSGSLVEIGLRAEQAALDRDSDAIFETGEIMYRVCQGCHMVYIPNSAPPPGFPD